VILIASLRLAAEWFRPQEFATISGWSQTVGNVGALVASSPLAFLVETLGWRQSFVVIGTLTLLLAVAAGLFVRDRPEAMGLAPVNPGPTVGAMPTLTETLRGIPGIFSNPRSWPPVLATAGIYSSLIAFLGLWGVPYLTQVYGLGRVEASTYPSLLAIGIVVGAPLVGWLSDRWLGLRRLPFIAFTAVYTACWALLALPGEMRLPLGALAPVLLLMGFASSGLVLVFVCVREVNDPARVGITLGFCNLPVFLVFALVQWLTGLILDARWTGLIAGGVRIYPAAAWEAAFAFCLAAALAALVLTFFVAETRCRNVWRPR
jgi:sugar phosphate permease